MKRFYIIWREKKNHCLKVKINIDLKKNINVLEERNFIYTKVVINSRKISKKFLFSPHLAIRIQIPKYRENLKFF